MTDSVRAFSLVLVMLKYYEVVSWLEQLATYLNRIFWTRTLGDKKKRGRGRGHFKGEAILVVSGRNS